MEKASLECLELEVDVTAQSSETHVKVSLDEALERIGTHRMQWFIIAISAFSYAHFSLQTMVPTLSIQSLFERWPELESRPVYFNSVFAAGAFARLVGSLLFLPLLDRFGRRNLLMVCLTVSVLAACSSALAPSFPVYVTLRALALFFTSVLPAAATVYSVELVHTKIRGLPGMLCQTVATLNVVFGTFMASAVGGQNHAPFAWRWITLLSSAPAVIPCLLLACTWLETPRFLLSVKKSVPQAWKVLHRLSPGTSKDLQLKLLGTESPSSRRVESLVQIEVPKDSADEESTSFFRAIAVTLRGMLRILWGKEDRILTYSLLVCWALQAFSHWGLSAYLTLFCTYIGVDVTWTTAASFLIQLPGQALLYFLMQSRLGRIDSIKLFATLCTVAHMILALLLRFNVASKPGLTVMAMMCFFFGGPLWGPIYTYSAERYPTARRSSAMALFTSTGSISTIITTYVGSVSLDRNRTWVYPLIWGALRFGIVLCAFAWRRETTKLRLDDCVGDATPQASDDALKIVSKEQSSLTVA